MRVLITSSVYAPFGFGGTATYARDLAEGLVERGHEVHVMFSQEMYEFHRSNWRATFKTEIPRELNGVFLYPVSSALGPRGVYLTYLLGSSPSAEKQFQRLVGQVKPDVVHHQHLFALGYKVLRRHGTYFSLFKAHDYWPICHREDLLWKGRLPCQKKACFWCGLSSIGDRRPPQPWRWTGALPRALRNVDLISAPSMYMKKRLAAELNGRIEFVTNFVAPPQEDVEESGYNGYYLFVGLLKPQKGVLQLLEVFRKHGAEIPARLLLVGTGVLEDEAKSFVAKHRLEEKVLLLGWVEKPRLWSLYRDAIALVMPSVWPENNPLVALEALASGTPVIGSDQGGIPEIVEKVDSKLIFHDGDWEGLAGILAGLDRRKYPSERIKQVYQESYSRERYLEKYERLAKG
jgi:glycosyltransferase involved in cell wall biosynthesis